MKIITKILAPAMLLTALAACEKTESYSELLRDEEKAVNWYLSTQKVVVDIPEDGNFLIGADAPYYKLNEEGTVYMQIIDRGDVAPGDERPEEGDKVYFRYMRCDIRTLMAGGKPTWNGNADNFGTSMGVTFFIFGEKYLTSSLQYGTGLQEPMKYVGYNSEVNLVMKASQGFTNESSQCIPFLYNVRYFKAEY